MIQSISDIITNSSSEVFVIKGQKKRNQEIMNLIIKLYKLLGRKIDDDLEMSVSPRDYKDYRDVGYKCRRGDVIIKSIQDNSIPCAIMDFIEGLPSLLDCLNYGDIERHHLG